MHGPSTDEGCVHKPSNDVLKHHRRIHENPFPSLLTAALLVSARSGR